MDFMYQRRSPIISRALDSLANKSLEEFEYLPADGYISLLRTSNKMKMGSQAVKSLQRYLTKKI